MEYEFTCDPNKNKANIRRHGIDLLEAGELLYGSYVDIEDDRKDYGEERCIAKGYLNDIPIVVVYVLRDYNNVHVISARKLKRLEEFELIKELMLEVKEQKRRK